MYARSVFSVCFVTALAFSSNAFAQASAADAFPIDRAVAWARADHSRPGRDAMEDQLEPAFRMFNTSPQAPRTSGVVTLHELEHRVPGNAVREFERALKAQSKGEHENAVEHFKKAIEIDPEFCAARNDLGASYLRLRRVELAIDQFNKAIAVDPHLAMPYSNLAVAYFMQDKPADAERAARREVDLDRGGTRGRLMLGLSLVLQRKFTREAEQSLGKALHDFPQASLLLARVLAARGEIECARVELQRYLATGDRSAVEIANQWMRQFNSAAPYEHR